MVLKRELLSHEITAHDELDLYVFPINQNQPDVFVAQRPLTCPKSYPDIHEGGVDISGRDADHA